MACTQPPVVKDGGQETGNRKLKTERAFWEPSPERKREHLADLARNKLWMDIVYYAKQNPDVVRNAIAHLIKARREIITFREMEREYCRDADRLLQFIAEESPHPSIGKRAVADIVLMGSAGGEEVFKGHLLSGIAMRARNPEVARHALEQMRMLGMKLELRWVAEALAGMGTGKYAAELFAGMEASDLHASGHGC